MTLKAVKSWMSFFGWTNEGGPGAVKLDTNRKPIASYKDRQWDADLAEAERMAAREENGTQR